MPSGDGPLPRRERTRHDARGPRPGPPVPVPSGFVLFRVLARTQADPAASATQKAALADSLRAKEAERLIRSVTQQMRADRKVEINDALLDSLLPPPAKPG